MVEIPYGQVLLFVRLVRLLVRFFVRKKQGRILWRREGELQLPPVL